MEYTDNEKSILALIERTDFKNLSKNDLLTYASKLRELRPEVATQVISQFPELAGLLKSALVEYKGMLDSVVSGDNDSLNHVYDVIGKDMANADKSRSEYFELADKVRADLSKCLDNPTITPEQQKEIIEKELEILQMVDKKDTEIRAHESEAVSTADKKDSEKRMFNWKLIGAASTVVTAVVVVGITAITGGEIKLKLPKNL